jgi:uncharacterized protein YbjT (DUF2867 family)
MTEGVVAGAGPRGAERIVQPRSPRGTWTMAGCFLARLVEEALIGRSLIPDSIVHATPSFEFIGSIADSATDGTVVHVPPIAFQPMAADDVADAVVRIAVGAPRDGIVEVGGPERLRFDEVVRRVLAARQDPRDVVADPAAGYFGIAVSERSLVPDEGAMLGDILLDGRLRQSIHP